MSGSTIKHGRTGTTNISPNIYHINSQRKSPWAPKCAALAYGRTGELDNVRVLIFNGKLSNPPVRLNANNPSVPAQPEPEQFPPIALPVALLVPSHRLTDSQHPAI
jgi:hypothetical protein